MRTRRSFTTSMHETYAPHNGNGSPRRAAGVAVGALEALGYVAIRQLQSPGDSLTVHLCRDFDTF